MTDVLYLIVACILVVLLAMTTVWLGVTFYQDLRGKR